MISLARSSARSPVALALLALASACSPAPAKTPAPIAASEMIEVPYPPPPARVETIPAMGAAGQVWLDGQWTWGGEVWSWGEGAWVTPPPDAYFTPWSTQRRADGQLLFARAAWRDRAGHPLDREAAGQICPIPAPAVGAPPR